MAAQLHILVPLHAVVALRGVSNALPSGPVMGRLTAETTKQLLMSVWNRMLKVMVLMQIFLALIR